MTIKTACMACEDITDVEIIEQSPSMEFRDNKMYHVYVGQCLKCKNYIKVLTRTEKAEDLCSDADLENAEKEGLL